MQIDFPQSTTIKQPKINNQSADISDQPPASQPPKTISEWLGKAEQKKKKTTIFKERLLLRE